MRSHWALTAGVSAAIGLTLLAGCGGTTEPSAASPSTSPSSTIAAFPPTSPAADARTVADRDAVAAYAGMLRTWVEAATTANPETPALRQYTQGEALKFLSNHLYGMQLQHMVVLGEPGTSPTAIDARPLDVPTTVLVRDCLDSTRWLQHKASGELWDDKPGTRQELKAVVMRTDAGWKVDNFALRDVTC